MLLGAPAPQRSHTCTTGALRASSRGEADDSVLASGERDRLHAPMPLHIVVPYRDRPEQLALFDAHMHAYLERNGVDDYVVWIIEQSADGRPFNRGAVRNAGVREVIAAYGSPRTVICFHDVDTLPLVDGLPYGEPRAHYAVTHIYGHTHCLGGVLCARAAAIVAADGYPNSLWGWGREDALLEERVARTVGADAIDRSELCERWVSAGFCEVPSGERVRAGWSVPGAGASALAAALESKRDFMLLFKRRVASGEYARVAARAKEVAAAGGAAHDGLRTLRYRVVRREEGGGAAGRTRRVVIELLDARAPAATSSAEGARAGEEEEEEEESLD